MDTPEKRNESFFMIANEPHASSDIYTPIENLVNRAIRRYLVELRADVARLSLTGRDDEAIEKASTFQRLKRLALDIEAGRVSILSFSDVREGYDEHGARGAPEERGKAHGKGQGTDTGRR